MNQTEFQRTLEDLQKEAESRGGQIDMEAIRARFSREPLSEEHLGLICEYLLSRKILVSGYEKRKISRRKNRRCFRRTINFCAGTERRYHRSGR